MLCENCGQHKAEIHLVRVMNGARVEEDICRECAEKMVPFDDAQRALKMSFSLEGMMNVSDALKNLLFPMLPELYAAKGDDLKCPHCGQKITPEELFDIQGQEESEEKNVIFDFSHFGVKEEAPMQPSSEEAAQAVFPDLNTQSVPNSAEQELGVLAQELTVALSEERYERAAEIRDRVEAIKRIMTGNEPKEE